MKRVFISHPCADNPVMRREQNMALIERLAEKHPDVLFISPLLLFGYLDEDGDYRDEILETCKDMILNIVDEVWVFGDSEGCRFERSVAEMYGVPVRDFARKGERI